MACLRIATMNINGVKAPTRQRMLMEFIKVHEIDILLVQEVTTMIQHEPFGYEIHYNIGTSKRGTAIVAREGIRLESIIRLTSKRDIGVRFRDT
jgi:exonuclease III